MCKWSILEMLKQYQNIIVTVSLKVVAYKEQNIIFEYNSSSYASDIGMKSHIVISLFQAVFSVRANNSSVGLVEETGVPLENHRPVASHRQTLSHNVVSSTLRHERDLNSKL